MKIGKIFELGTKVIKRKENQEMWKKNLNWRKLEKLKEIQIFFVKLKQNLGKYL